MYENGRVYIPLCSQMVFVCDSSLKLPTMLSIAKQLTFLIGLYKIYILLELKIEEEAVTSEILPQDR